MALYPSVRRDMFGMMPMNVYGYPTMRMLSPLPFKELSYFGNGNIVSYSSIPENSFGSLFNTLAPLVGGGMLVNHAGTGTVSANLLPTRVMAVNLTGTSTVSATAALVVSLQAALTGTGTVSATITGRLDASVSLTGSSTLTAAMTAIGQMVVDLDGTGDLDATIAAFGDMQIDIVVTGTGLTTANVGQAVWDYLLASGYSASEAMDILTAVAAGKVSGGPGSPVFRSVDDTRDVVSGTADTDGNRSSSTITPEG